MSSLQYKGYLFLESKDTFNAEGSVAQVQFLDAEQKVAHVLLSKGGDLVLMTSGERKILATCDISEPFTKLFLLISRSGKEYLCVHGGSFCKTFNFPSMKLVRAFDNVLHVSLDDFWKSGTQQIKLRQPDGHITVTDLEYHFDSEVCGSDALLETCQILKKTLVNAQTAVLKCFRDLEGVQEKTENLSWELKSRLYPHLSERELVKNFLSVKQQKKEDQHCVSISPPQFHIAFNELFCIFNVSNIFTSQISDINLIACIAEFENAQYSLRGLPLSRKLMPGTSEEIAIVFPLENIRLGLSSLEFQVIFSFRTQEGKFTKSAPKTMINSTEIMTNSSWERVIKFADEFKFEAVSKTDQIDELQLTRHIRGKLGYSCSDGLSLMRNPSSFLFKSAIQHVSSHRHEAVFRFFGSHSQFQCVITALQKEVNLNMEITTSGKNRHSLPRLSFEEAKASLLQELVILSKMLNEKVEERGERSKKSLKEEHAFLNRHCLNLKKTIPRTKLAAFREDISDTEAKTDAYFLMSKQFNKHKL